MTFKYINILQIFHNVTVFLLCSLVEHNRLYFSLLTQNVIYVYQITEHEH